MLSIVIVTGRDERKLVTTLAALVSGAAAGLVSEVLMVEATGKGEKPDATMARVADVAGCHLISIEGSQAAARDAGARAARSPWLMILQPGAIPENGWTEEIAQFIARDFGGEAESAVFRYGRDPYYHATVTDVLKATVRFAVGPFADQGLLIPRDKYRQITNASPPLTDSKLLSKIGRRHIRTLRTRLFVS